MSDQPTPTPDASEVPAQIATSSTATTSDINSLPPAWQEEIRKLREENKRRRQAETESETKVRQAEEARLAEQGKWQEIAETRQRELDALKAKAALAEAYEAQGRETVAKRIAALPEQYRALVPQYDDPLKTLQWLDANAAILMLPTPPPTDAGAGSDSSKNAALTPEESAMANKMGIDPKKVAANKARS